MYTPKARSRIKKLFIYLGLIFIISLLLAIPLVIITRQWSMDTSYNIYGGLTRILHLHSPSIVIYDEEGVPIVDLGYQKGIYVGAQRNPLTIATKAISYYEEFEKSGNIQKREYFINCINWLENNKIDKSGYYLWAYEMQFPSFNVTPPWYSAMAQTRIVVAFERAYELTGDGHYIQNSDKAMRALNIPIADGGVLYIDPTDNGKWYEEVAGGGRVSPPLILNGFIFSLLDLNDYYIHTDSQEAKLLFYDGVTELKRHLSEYDTGRWTNYDLIGHPAYDYHYVHIDQMEKLYKITGDTEFKEYHDKWASYFPFNPLWARQRFAAYLFDFVITFFGLTVIFFSYKYIRKRIKNK
jgi:hypothetical protein